MDKMIQTQSNRRGNLISLFCKLFSPDESNCPIKKNECVVDDFAEQIKINEIIYQIHQPTTKKKEVKQTNTKYAAD